MRSSLFQFGVAATALWLVISTTFMVLASKPGPLMPNEWGDVFAGLAAPVAFLWLVLGFLQQGKELQLSSRALELQVEELRNSVEQQKELVEVTRQQVLATIEDQNRRTEVERTARLPRFALQTKSIVGNSYGLTVELEIFNMGAPATDIEYTLDPEPAQRDRGLISHLQTGSSVVIRFQYQSDLPATGTHMSLRYIDAMKSPGAAHFLLYRDSGHFRAKPLDDTELAQKDSRAALSS